MVHKFRHAPITKFNEHQLVPRIDQKCTIHLNEEKKYWHLITSLPHGNASTLTLNESEKKINDHK